MVAAIAMRSTDTETKQKIEDSEEKLAPPDLAEASHHRHEGEIREIVARHRKEENRNESREQREMLCGRS